MLYRRAKLLLKSKMARLKSPRTQIFEPFKKQFYQWYFTDDYTLYQVTVLFDWLFLMLFNVNKANYYAT